MTPRLWVLGKGGANSFCVANAGLLVQTDQSISIRSEYFYDLDNKGSNAEASDLMAQ
ncbi:hypothetical protein N9C56_09950 [Paracoccaceae bacterium]|nr:hypothetical protein [Paracoccaceae bacterium]